MDKTIQIDLSKEQTAGTDVRDFQSLLQRDAYRNVLSHLLISASAAKSTQENHHASASVPPQVAVKGERKHDVVMVEAERGGGKTTFLVSLLKLLEQGTIPQGTINQFEISNIVSNPENKTFYSLGILDPTQVEEKQNIIVLILNRIHSAVQHHANKIATPFNETTTSVDRCNKKLRELARGLTHLPGIGNDTIHDERWHDPDFVLDEGLQEADAGDRFEEKLDDYIHSALDVLRKDVFVLAIDDIDTSFERGWPVLEALRKHLTSDRLKLILSGDLSLYRHLVRRQQWQMFGSELLEQEKNKQNDLETPIATRSTLHEIYQTIDELEDQYLVKLFPPQNRHGLLNLFQLVYVLGYDIQFYESNHPRASSDTVSARQFFRNYAQYAFDIVDESSFDQFMKAVLVQPLRTSMRILPASVTVDHETRLADPRARQEITSSLRRAAYVPIANMGLNPDVLDTDNVSEFLRQLVQWFTSMDDWRALPRLFPAFTDRRMNIALCAISASLSEAFRREPAGMVEYFTKVASVRDLFDSGRIPQDQITDFVNHIRLTHSENSMDTAGYIAGWLRSRPGLQDLSHRLSPYELSVLMGDPWSPDAIFIELMGVRYTQQPESQTQPQHRYPQIAIESLKSYSTESANWWHEKPNHQEGKRTVVSRLEALPVPIRCFHERLTERGIPYAQKEGKHIYQKWRFYNSIESLSTAISIGKEEKESNVRAPAADALEISFFNVLSGQNFDYGTFSIVRIIGFLENAISLLDWTSETETSDTLKPKVRQLLRKATADRSYPSRQSSQATSQETPIEDSESEFVDGDLEVHENYETEPPEHHDVSEELVDIIVAWLLDHFARMRQETGGVFPRIGIAPVTLERAWTRFHYSSNRVAEDITHLGTRYLGVMIHRYIVLFLHALAVEVKRSQGEFLTKATENTPRSNSGPLFAILRAIYTMKYTQGNESVDGFSVSDIGKAPPLFDLIFSCPLWGFFLMWKDEWEDKRNRREKLYHDEVFEVYRQRVSSILQKSGSEVSSFFNVPYAIAKRNGGGSTEFENLVIPLNSVPIRRQQPTRGPINWLAR